MDLLRDLAGTAAHRPYVVPFLAAYLVLATRHLGLWRALLFLGAGYAIAWSSEISSITNGFPYGLYHYKRDPAIREAWVAGVPLFDSLSYVFLAYAGFSVALLFAAPLSKGALPRLADTPALRRSVRVLLLGGLLTTLLDVVVDPVANQGHHWFLGDIYDYDRPGLHFGVPLSNYAGWWGVSTLMVGALQGIDRLIGPRAGPGQGPLPGDALGGALLWLGVVVFQVAVAAVYVPAADRGPEIALAGALVALPVVALAAARLADPRARATPEEIRAHDEAYPAKAIAAGAGR